MKRKTIYNLMRNLNKDKALEESFEKNKDFVYEIEFLPVLTKRDNQGELQEVTYCDNRLLMKCEKDD